MSKRKSVKEWLREFSCNLVNEQSRSFEFSAETNDEFESGGTWRVHEKITQLVNASCEKAGHEDYSSEASDGWYPIYNVAYPLDDRWDRNLPDAPPEKIDKDDPTRWLSDFLVCTTVVEINGSPHLALTGCGMDMSWYLVETYAALGYLPPAYMRHPQMAMTFGEKEKRLCRVMQASYEFAIESAKRALDDHKRMLKWFRTYAEKRKQTT
jgi:hypothetical protein